VLRPARILFLDFEMKARAILHGLFFWQAYGQFESMVQVVGLKKKGAYSGPQIACRTPVSLPLRQFAPAARHDPYLQDIIDCGLKGQFHGG
jgi:hypothetical protein